MVVLENDFDRFYLATRGALLRQLTAATADPEHASDSLQGAYARAWQRWPRLSSTEDPEAWVLATASRLAGRGRPRTPPRDEPAVDEWAMPEAATIRAAGARRTRVRGALALAAVLALLAGPALLALNARGDSVRTPHPGLRLERDWSVRQPTAVVRQPDGSVRIEFLVDARVAPRAVAEHGGRFVVVAHRSGPGARLVPLWFSDDGTSWRRPIGPAVPGAVDLRGVGADERGFVAVGVAEHDGTRQPAAWYSRDGLTWSRSRLDLPRGGADGSGPLQGPVRTSAGWFVWTALDTHDAWLWLSGEGTSWSEVEDEALFEGATICGVRQQPGGGLTTYGAGTADGSTALRWGSTDGFGWRRTRTAPDDATCPPYPGQAARSEDGSLAVETGPGGDAALVWRPR